MRTYLGSFQREEDLLQAAECARREGWPIVDIYTPYPVHGTARVLGLGRSRLPRVALFFGLLGVGLAFWFQYWISAFDWPINIGGRPWNSLPAFVPVAFEMMVLFAGLGLVFTWLVVCRLFPGKKAHGAIHGALHGALTQPRSEPRSQLRSLATDDHFVLEVQEPGPGADGERIRSLWQGCNVCGWEERV